jgi:hypothetical protein
MRLPKARRDKLTVRELPDETLIYDHATNKAHCLNQTAALVWHSCDGKTTVRELAAVLQSELGVSSAEPLIHLTLEKLVRRGLLETAPEMVRQDRRKLLRTLAVAALPVIMTMAAPRANAAASKPANVCAGKADLTSCGTGMQCCGGTCVTPSGRQGPCTSACNCPATFFCAQSIDCTPIGSFCCVQA